MAIQDRNIIMKTNVRRMKRNLAEREGSVWVVLKAYEDKAEGNMMKTGIQMIKGRLNARSGNVLILVKGTRI